MTLVSTVEVGSGGSAGIEWTSIPQDGKDLLILLSARLTANTNNLYLELNNENFGFSLNQLYGSGSSAASFGGSYNFLGYIPGTNYTASTFGNQSIYISNYTSTATKSISNDSVTENNATASWQEINAMSKTLSSAITTVDLKPGAGNFAQYTTASLYIIS